MAQKPQTPAEFSVPEALWYLCFGAGLALAPLPALHALPEEFIYFLFESPLPIRTRLAMPEPFWFTLLGLPITAIFLAWALPGAHRPGLPPRSIGLLWLLVAYNPLRHLLERYSYGELVATMVVAADQSNGQRRVLASGNFANTPAAVRWLTQYANPERNCREMADTLFDIEPETEEQPNEFAFTFLECPTAGRT